MKPVMVTSHPDAAVSTLSSKPTGAQPGSSARRRPTGKDIHDHAVMASRIVGTLAYLQYANPSEISSGRRRLKAVYQYDDAEMDELLGLAKRGDIRAVERKLVQRRDQMN